MTGDCPRCGKFCSDIMAHYLPESRGGGIRFVTGKCSKHGAVDLTDQDWSYEDFDPEYRKWDKAQSKEIRTSTVMEE